MNFFTCPTSGRLPTGRRYLNISEAIALAIHLRDRRMLRTGGFWAGAAEEQFGSGPNAYTYPYVKWGRVGGEGSIHCDKSTPPDQGVYWPTSSVVSLHR
jgi:hypothetical protein